MTLINEGIAAAVTSGFLTFIFLGLGTMFLFALVNIINLAFMTDITTLMHIQWNESVIICIYVWVLIISSIVGFFYGIFSTLKK